MLLNMARPFERRNTRSYELKITRWSDEYNKKIRDIQIGWNTKIPPDRTSGNGITGIPIRKIRIVSKELFWKNTRLFLRINNWYTKETMEIVESVWSC